MQIAYFLRSIILSSKASRTLRHFSTISHKRHDFQNKKKRKKGKKGKKMWTQMWILNFYATFVRNISHSKKNSAKTCVITNIHKSSSKQFVTLFKCEFSQCTFEKNRKISTLTLRRLMSYIYIYIYIWH